jgi:monomeric sarcosine oxidase
MSGKIYDVVVVGAGVFGSWIALQIARRGKSVLLVDAYGPGHSRSSSGDESRIIRMGYGPDEIYTQWSKQSLTQWKELFAAAGRAELFQQTGVLWLAEQNNPQLNATKKVLRNNGVEFQEFSSEQLAARYPQFNLDGIGQGIYESDSGVLLGRRAVAAVAKEAMRLGVEYSSARINEPSPGQNRSLLEVASDSGEILRARQFVFACGAWLAKLFPTLLGQRIFPTRQTVFYIGVPAGNQQFSSPNLPTWLIKNDECYGMPSIENRGFKIALDNHGERVDPDTQSRIATADEIAKIRALLAFRFPILRNAPITETRVCQYENSSSGDFLLDRHPGFDNVWLAGGGSGHGFKHGPAVGKYLAGQILDHAAPEARFALDNKTSLQNRAIY